LTSPPSFRKNNPADQPILMLNLYSKTLTMSALDEFAENLIASRISMGERGLQVQVQGAASRGSRPDPIPKSCTRKTSASTKVDQAITNWNVNSRRVSLYGANRTYPIKASGQLLTPTPSGDHRHLRNGPGPPSATVAHVIDSVENVFTATGSISENSAGKPDVERAITLQ